MAVVFRPDSKRLTELGFGSVAHVPLLLDSEQLQRARYMTLETIAPLRDDLALTLPATAA
ncbi:hypothetical protein [Azospirillum sp. SYSU D00513]|uniref:hypothetical protein n=1 Tax=Azospirillum sp. SYSU D00513 TaxID=2812561 RepID=UPI001A9771AB|nr:hypothetical protein [Azospirillum sp. SYSU D00513]